MRLNPYLTFNGDGEEAFRLYAQTLGGKIEYQMKYRGTPTAAQLPHEWHDKILHAALVVGTSMLQGGMVRRDSIRNRKGFSVHLNLKDRADAERIFKALAEDGTADTVQPMFWAARFGILVDRFGIPWMVNGGQPV